MAEQIVKIRSTDVTEGFRKAPARAMLRAVGMTDDDWDKPQIGVASSWNEVTPCNLPLDRLAKRSKEGVRAGGGFPLEFVTIAVSDGISMGHEGMRGSLVSREIIADSVECVMHSERFDGMVTFAGCDKSLPGMLMAAARLNLPSVFVYGGSILPGNHNGTVLDIVSVFEAVGACAAGAITEDELYDIERKACPGEGSCAGMFTANTMAAVGEALGMSLPGSASPAAPDRRRDDFAYESGKAVVELLRRGIRPRDIMTKKAFENAIAVVNALGGSTNAVLHLLAIAYEAEVDLTLDDFNRVADRVPHIADLKPGGKFHMIDLDRVGGVPVVMKHLLDAGLLHGDVMTVTGKTLAENLQDVPTLESLGKQTVVLPISKPLAPPNNHISVLKGNLAPESCLLKLSGKTLAKGEFRGTARVFESEADTMQAIRAGDIVPGTVIVVRNVGPVGGPGMPEMVMLTIQLQGRGLAEEVALITDGRFSGVSHGILIGHISPEAARGGPIAAVRDGDLIVIDPIARTLNLAIPDEEIANRMKSWRAPDHALRVRPGSVHDKYIRLVSTAHYGCVL